MFWKRWCRSFIRLNGGFILLRSGVIYTHADIDVYIFNSNISSYCIIIKTMGAALQSEKSSRRTAGAECRGTRVRLAPSAGGCWAAAAWALSAGPDTEGEGSRTLRVARASQEHLTRLTQTTTYLLPITKHQQRLHPPTEATLHSVCHTYDKHVWLAHTSLKTCYKYSAVFLQLPQTIHHYIHTHMH